ncbi:AsnC family protein [Salmonella enterica subsp. enterica serovar Pomona]|nr:AsnC family protein [Salmonella enterica subsp. enterica serovar Pomona]
MIMLHSMGKPGKCPAHCRPWSPGEEEQLIALHPSMTYAEIAIRLNRGIPAVRYRARLLRLSGRLSCKRRPFTPEDDAFIRDNRHTMTADEMAVHLNRTRGGIYLRVSMIGVSLFKCGDLNPHTKHTDEDVMFIRALRDAGLSFEEIGGKFEISSHVARSLYHHRLTAADACARELLP